MAKIGGRVYVKVDGETLMVRANVSTNIGQEVMRESVVGADGVHGRTATPVVPYIQIEVTEQPSFSLTRLNKIEDATVTARLEDGRTLLLSNAWHAGESDFNPVEGSMNVRFEGMKGEEVA